MAIVNQDMEISSHDLYEAIKWIVLVLDGKHDAEKPDIIKDILKE